MWVRRLIWLVGFWAPSVIAQTMYVTDSLVITLRSGPSTQNTILTNLSTGDSVELLEENDDGYSRVRVLDDGDEGWVLSRYLQGNPTSELLLTQTSRELTNARSRVAELEAQLTNTQTELSAVQAELSGLVSTRDDLSTELADIRSASANAIALRDQNENLRRTNNELSIEVDSLNNRTVQLASRSRQNWFVVGALVLAIGIVIGLVAPTLRRRKRTEW